MKSLIWFEIIFPCVFHVPMYAYMYVCMYVCMYGCMYVCMYVYMYEVFNSMLASAATIHPHHHDTYIHTYIHVYTQRYLPSLIQARISLSTSSLLRDPSPPSKSIILACTPFAAAASPHTYIHAALSPEIRLESHDHDLLISSCMYVYVCMYVCTYVCTIDMYTNTPKRRFLSIYTVNICGKYAQEVAVYYVLRICISIFTGTL
jgi:hypothetical protein